LSDGGNAANAACTLITQFSMKLLVLAFESMGTTSSEVSLPSCEGGSLDELWISMVSMLMMQNKPKIEIDRLLLKFQKFLY
jgi:hypothetical protein